MKYGLKVGIVSTQQKDLFRSRHGANTTEGSVKGMSPLDHGIMRNKRIRARVMILWQLMENSSRELSIRR